MLINEMKKKKQIKRTIDMNNKQPTPKLNSRHKDFMIGLHDMISMYDFIKSQKQMKKNERFGGTPPVKIGQKFQTILQR